MCQSFASALPTQMTSTTPSGKPTVGMVDDPSVGLSLSPSLVAPLTIRPCRRAQQPTRFRSVLVLVLVRPRSRSCPLPGPLSGSNAAYPDVRVSEMADSIVSSPEMANPKVPVPFARLGATAATRIVLRRQRLPEAAPPRPPVARLRSSTRLSWCSRHPRQ